MYYLIAISYLLIIALSVLYGESEAKFYYYVYNGKAKQLKRNEHNFWTIIRGLSFAPMMALFFYIFSWNSLWGIAAIGFMFPFFHDGSYYYFRNKFDGSYPKGFLDTSINSTAKTPTMPFAVRAVMLLISAVMIFGMLTE